MIVKKEIRPKIPRLIFGVALTMATLFFLAQQVEFADVWSALVSAETLPIFLGVIVIVGTGFVKAWRWQYLFYPAQNRPKFPPAFAAIMVNQFVNNVIFGRFGEIARVYHIDKSSQVGKGRALGTIVVEKSLEMLFTVLSVLVLLPWAVVPDDFNNPTLILAITTAGLLVTLYLLAYQSTLILRLAEWGAGFLPSLIGRKLLKLTSSSLQGLSVLRDHRAVAQQLSVSTLIAVLYVLTPYVLFSAFGLPYTLIDAALLNLGVSLAVAVVPGPLKIGVFEFSVITLLTRFNNSIDDSILLSYAIVYHVVVILPPTLIGGIAALRSDWSWRDAKE